MGSAFGGEVGDWRELAWSEGFESREEKGRQRPELVIKPRTNEPIGTNPSSHAVWDDGMAPSKKRNVQH